MKIASRRRSLVSLGSMLFVSMLALGTATFAWFTNNKSVTADGMQVTAAAAKGLQITGDHGDEWGPTYTFKTSAILQPVSFPYSTSATAYGNFSKGYYPNDVAVTGAWSTATNANFANWKDDVVMPECVSTDGGDCYGLGKVGQSNYCVAYEVGVRSTGDPIPGVKMKVNYDNATAAKDYIRVAVLKEADGEKTAITSDEIVTVIGNETGANAITTVDPKTAPQYLQAGNTEIDVDDVTTTPQYYTVLVWFEGQDEQCVDANQGLSGLVTINFEYK
jgi:hypothetical protein